MSVLAVLKFPRGECEAWHIVDRMLTTNTELRRHVRYPVAFRGYDWTRAWAFHLSNSIFVDLYSQQTIYRPSKINKVIQSIVNFGLSLRPARHILFERVDMAATAKWFARRHSNSIRLQLYLIGPNWIEFISMSLALGVVSVCALRHFPSRAAYLLFFIFRYFKFVATQLLTRSDIDF